MICHVCHREAKGFGFIPPAQKDAKFHHACSIAHLKRLSGDYKKDHKIMDTTPNEQASSLAGLTAGWQYASSIGKTDMALFTAPEAAQFALCITHQYTMSLAEFHSQPTEAGDIPF